MGTFERPDTEWYPADPAGTPPGGAAVTDLAVVAHPDDLELLVPGVIGTCLCDPVRRFVGVVCTDGAGSARSGQFAGLTDDQMIGVRRSEQRAAADIGGYTVAMLGHPSSDVRAAAGRDGVATEVRAVLAAHQPTNLYTHNLADKHPTHVAVAAATLMAIRQLPPEGRPNRVVGVEAWRDLDWLPDPEKVRLDVTAHAELATTLARQFPSQIAGGKRYDLAVEGRRRANATLGDPHAVDDSEQLVVAMDLTPLARNDDLDPVAYVTAAIDRFRHQVATGLRRHFPAPPPPDAPDR